MDYAAVALLALLDFADSTSNTNTTAAEDHPPLQPLSAATTQSTPASDSPTHPHASRQRRVARSRVWDDFLTTRSPIDLSGGDRPSVGSSTELVTHETVVPTESSQSVPQTNASETTRGGEDTEESMRLSDAD
ncbi:hypothetical protein D915_005983 [Fasciola hepatica]|uniref:Uncharacterized protein n=1 Tax=Fasciola hepatica TaxID=6192 RepID=A0A4E0RZV9_FASHE|nr:hypothetical protein D915_005983 [Fasciola hepatica]